MGTHTGTHVDAPRHFFDDGAGVDALSLDLLIGRARVVEITKRGGIGTDELPRRDCAKTFACCSRPRTRRCGMARVSTRTTPISPRTARGISSIRASRLWASTTCQSSSSRRRARPAHRALLSQSVIIIEGLNLAEVEAGMYEMYCLPLRIAGGDGAPARVVLKR